MQKDIFNTEFVISLILSKICVLYHVLNKNINFIMIIYDTMVLENKKDKEKIRNIYISHVEYKMSIDVIYELGKYNILNCTM